MRLCVYATIQGGPTYELYIPCGEGKQTVKWLVLTAVNRLSSSQCSREVFSTQCGFNNFSPTEVTKGNPSKSLVDAPSKPFLHPMDSIIQHFSDGDSLTVHLLSEVRVNEVRRPLVSQWGIVAFDVSASKSERRQRAVGEIKRKAAECENAAIAARQKEQQEIFATKAKYMRSILRSKKLDDEALDQNLKEDLLAMLELKTFVAHCGSSQILYDVQQIIKDNYAAANELYKTCSASTGSEQNSAQNSIEQAEFSSFLFDSKIFDVRCSMDVSSNIFMACLCPGETIPSIRRPGFLIAIVYIAWLKYIDGGNKTGQISRQIPQEYANKSARANLPLANAVTMLFEEYLNPQVKNGGVGFLAAQALDDDEILAYLHDFEHELRSKFEKYSSSLSDSGTKIMKLEDFGAITDHARLLIKSNEGVALNIKEMRQAFAGAQYEQNSDFYSSHMLEMDYQEFIGGLIRVALIKHRKSSSGCYNEEVKSIISKVCSIP